MITVAGRRVRTPDSGPATGLNAEISYNDRIGIGACPGDMRSS